MKKSLIALAALLALTSCGDKILTAKLAVNFVALGVETAKSVVKQVAEGEKQRCLKLGKEDSSEFAKCYEKTQQMVSATNKLWPQLDQALVVAADAIKAGDEKKYEPLIKSSICLLTKLATWLPEKWRAKIQQWLNLASTYSCPKESACTPKRNAHELIVQYRQLLIELGARS